VAERVPGSFGFDPVREIQILTPMNRGQLGVHRLNRVLQDRLNPTGKELERGLRRLREGDKVMQLRNNYELDVFNGDLGRLLALDDEEQRLTVAFDGRRVLYEFSELDQLTPAYACTIHKSQGSEYPCVLVPLHHQHFRMLQRNLLYTALTRAKQLAIFVGQRQALATAVRNQDTRRRCTRLAQRLATRKETPS
jgi:exodeoxyribonuclease V alpha subunit